ncbi:MAG: hypothetical protein IAE81_10715 [Caldilineaceae bacterium]|nr:hypothetical protein [Caldilineaceae bacterium]
MIQYDLSGTSTRAQTEAHGLTHKKLLPSHKMLAASLLLVMLLTAACQPVPRDPGSRVREAAQGFVDQVGSDPSSCARDFRVIEPNLTRTPQQMDFNAGYYQGIMQNTGDVSFVVKGQFPNSILLSWVIYDANGQIYSAVNDQELTPDVGNVNPFLPGVDVLAANRSYTAFFMPEGAVAPEGIAASNVLTLPPVSTSDRIYITMRSYWSQPGYPRVGGPTPTIQAVSAADPTQPATCPGLGLDEDLFPLAPFTIPTPESGRILFFRPPNHIIPMADGTKTAEPNGCTGYGMAQLSDTDLNVIKLHKVPVFPDNQNLTESSVWSNDFEVRYVGLEANGASLLGPRSDIAMNDLKQQADGSALLVTIPRPSDLSAKERLALLEKARANNWNIMPSAGEGAQVAPFLTYRNKLADASFPYSITAIPCFGSDLGEWSEATIDYASSPENMGEYYIDGVICTIDEVLDDSCVQQLANE